MLQKAKKFTSSLVYGKQVKFITYDIDRYGRTIGIVLVNGINLNEEIVRNELADNTGSIVRSRSAQTG